MLAHECQRDRSRVEGHYHAMAACEIPQERGLGNLPTIGHTPSLIEDRLVDRNVVGTGQSVRVWIGEPVGQGNVKVTDGRVAARLAQFFDDVAGGMPFCVCGKFEVLKGGFGAHRMLEQGGGR